MPTVKNNKIVNELLIWYEQNKRELPWRNEQDAYKIWLSEIILQQTRVDQGLPYYTKFTEKYPNIYALADATENDVLRTWQGLGYYSRARNLHKCAKTIANNYNGVFPSTRDELMKLPGIGPYTSSAIASIAYGKKEAVVDGNVIRLITRLYGIEEDISNTHTQTKIKDIVDELIPSSKPDLFNQAIMEFGALQCTPKNPKCNLYPFLRQCESQLNGLIDKIPFKAKRIKVKTRYFNYLTIEIDGKFLMTKRKNKDIWQGLFEFVLLEHDTNTDVNELNFPEALLLQPDKWEIQEESRIYKHLLSHQKIMTRFIKLKIRANFKFNLSEWKNYRLYSNEEIEVLPKSILIDRYLGEKII